MPVRGPMSQYVIAPSTRETSDLKCGGDLVVRPRLMGERGDVWRDLVALLSDGPVPLTWLVNRADASEPTRRWMLAIEGRDLAWQFDRFASYLYDGTLQPMLSVRAKASGDLAPVSAEEM